MGRETHVLLNAMTAGVTGRQYVGFSETAFDDFNKAEGLTAGNNLQRPAEVVVFVRDVIRGAVDVIQSAYPTAK